MVIREVEVVAAVGTSLGVVSIKDGVLTLVCRHPDATEWPHGVLPDDGGPLTIQPGYTRFAWLDGDHAD